MIWLRRLLWLVAGLLTLVGLAPVASLTLAAVIANRYGCRLHEGFPEPCLIGGTDWGGTLYQMGVAGWLMLLTLPLLALGLVLGIAALIWTLVARARAAR